MLEGRDEEGRTALHLACLQRQKTAAELLLKHGADVSARITGAEATPLHCAFRGGSQDIAMLLLRYGASLLAQDAEGNTPVHYALRYCNPTHSETDSSSSNDHSVTLSRGRTSELKDYEGRPDYVAALEMRNRNGLRPQEMVEVGLQQIVEKLAFTFFDKPKKPRHVPRTSNPQADKENRNERPSGGRTHRCNAPGRNTKPRVKKLHVSNAYRLHYLQQQGSPESGRQCNATTEVESKELSSNAEEVSSARCGDVASEQVRDASQQDLESYEALKLLGKGSFGEVYLVRHKETQELYAMKIIQKTKIMSQNLVRYAITEKKVMAQTNHPFIVKLRSAFQTKERLFLIMDYCPGGDLSQYLARERRFSEDRARLYVAEIVLAIEDLHKRNIIYRYYIVFSRSRDLKPDNIVLDQDGHAMLTDFGLSKEGIDGPEAARSFCGSIAYLAPEILKRTGHGKSVDWYLLGVLLYEMLFGQPPYFSSSRQEYIN